MFSNRSALVPPASFFMPFSRLLAALFSSGMLNSEIINSRAKAAIVGGLVADAAGKLSLTHLSH